MVFTLQFIITFNCHDMKPKLARFLRLAENSRIKVSKGFCSYLMGKSEFVPLIFAYNFAVANDGRMNDGNEEVIPESARKTPRKQRQTGIMQFFSAKKNE